MRYPLVSIITVNYNQSKVTCEFLASIQHITYKNIEIIVVDNGSPNDTPEIMKEKYPDINLIISKENLGFAGGNNIAIREAKGKYLLFINNYTEVPVDFLEPMVDLLENDSSVGMVSPKIKFFDKPDTFQFAGFTPMKPYTIRTLAVGFGEKDTGQFDITHETDSIFGAAMLVPMKVIKEVGLMDDIFFLYYEEHDWAYRIKQAGYKIYYQGKSCVLHKESISTVKDSPLQIYYITRNRVLFARRNRKGITLFISLLYMYIITIPRISIEYILKGRFDLLMAFFKAMIWNFTHYKGIKKSPKLQ